MLGLFNFMAIEDIAIDLGTANTLIIHRDKIVMDAPSIVAKDLKTDKIIATGHEANQMQGKTNNDIKTIRPLKDGVIADFQCSEEMIKQFIKNIPAFKKKWFTPSLRMVICIPSGITEVEKRAVQDSARHANARETYLIYEPIAAALGAGIDINEAKGNMIIDIGGGTTEIAVISLSGIVCDKSIKVAGDLFTDDIKYYLQNKHNLFVGEHSAEKVKISIGAVIEDLEDPPKNLSIQGRNLISGKPIQVDISYKEIAQALDKSIGRIENAIMEVLSKTPPELSADIYKKGIYLAGGGALLKGIAERISSKTDLPVHIADDPLKAVIRGTGIALKNLQKYKTVLSS